MEKIKRAYTFAFCVIYKSIEKLKYAFWSDWKTILVMCMAEVYFIGSFTFLIEALLKKSIFLNIPMVSIVIFSATLVLIKIFIFIINDRWKDYMLEFDSLPEAQRKKWTKAVWLVLVLILAFLALSIYVYSQVDWQKLREESVYSR